MASVSLPWLATSAWLPYAHRPRMSSIPDPNDRGFVASLAKGLSILSAFEQSDVLGNQELVEITGMPKATVSRFTGTLEKLGYLRFDDQVRKYRVGGRTLNFGSITMQKHGIQRIAAPLMRQLAQTLDVTVLLATREHAHMLLLEVVRPPVSTITINKAVGDLLAMETTSLGLAYLVAAAANERTAILKNLQRMASVDWTSYRADVERVHAEYKRLGFVVSRRVRGGVLSAAAVPIVTGSEIFVLSCAGPSQQLSKALLEKRVGPLVAQAARSIRDAMRDP